MATSFGGLIPNGYNGTFMFFQMLSGVTPVTGITPTVVISKAGAAFSSPANAPTELAHGWYYCAGSGSDTNTNGPLLLYATGAGADPTNKEWQIGYLNNYSSNTLGIGALPNAGPGSAGGLPTVGNGAGQITLSSGQVTATFGSSAPSWYYDPTTILTDTYNDVVNIQTVVVSSNSTLLNVQTAVDATSTSVGSGLATNVANISTSVGSGLGTAVSAISTSVGSGLSTAVSNISTSVGSGLATAVDAISTSVGSGLATAVDAISTSVGSGLATLVTALPTSVWTTATVIDGDTPQAAMRYISAALAGVVSGAPSGPLTFKGLDGTTTRLIVTCDAYGNRSSITYD